MELSAQYIPPSHHALISGADYLRRLVAFFLGHSFSTLSPARTISRISSKFSICFANPSQENASESDCTLLPGRVYRISGDPDSIAPLHDHWPMLAQLTWRRKWVVCVSPPMAIPSSLLNQEGINEARFMGVNAKSAEGRSWALLQALQGRHCGAVLYWGALTESAQRQLESVVQESGVYCLWFKSE